MVRGKGHAGINRIWIIDHNFLDGYGQADTGSGPDLYVPVFFSFSGYAGDSFRRAAIKSLCRRGIDISS